MLSDDYYRETVKCLQECKSDPIEEHQIYLEFAQECFLDLNLKNCAFRDREVLALAIRTINQSMGPVSGKELRDLNMHEENENKEFKEGRTSIEKELFPSGSGLIATRRAAASKENREEKLQGLAVRRMMLIQSAMSAVSSVLVGSELIEGRYDVLSGPIPMDAQSWLDVLAPNIYLQVCSQLGCDPESVPNSVLTPY